MEFTKLDIYTESAKLEPLADRLAEMGVSGFEFHDAADFEEYLKSGVKNWDYIGEELDPLRTQKTHLTLYLTKDAQGEELLRRIQAELRHLLMTTATVREEDWAENWKQYFKPFEIGKKLLIKPTWEEVSETDRLILEIDPASAFGTGQHESTKLCLEALESVIEPNSSFCDLGCGSGILTIAALLLGANNAVMADISENAVRVAEKNLSQNGFVCNAFCGDITEDAELLEKIGGNFDVITANIVADVIIKMGAAFPKLLKKGGKLVTSGIIKERLDEVKSELIGAELEIIEIKQDNGWCLIIAKN